MAIDIQELTGGGVRIFTGHGRAVRSGDREIKAAYPTEGEFVHRPLPVQLIERYAFLARHRAVVEEMEDEAGWFASVHLLPGVWGTGESEEAALDDLEATIRDWVTLKMQLRHLDIPDIAGLDLNR